MAYSGRSGSRKPGGNSGNRSRSGSKDSKPSWKKGGSSRGGDSDRPAFKKKSFGDRDDKPAFKKKAFGDKPAFKRRDDGDERPRKSYGDKPFGDKPAFKRRSSEGDDRPRKSYGDRDDKPAFKRRSSDGDDRPRKSYGDRDDKPAFKKSFGDKPYGDRKRSGDSDDRPRKSYGDRDDKPAFKKSFGDKPYGDRKRSGDSDDRPRKSFGDKPFRSRDASRSDKPFGDRKREGGDDRPAFRKSSFGSPSDRPRKSFSERGSKPSWKRGDRDEQAPKKRGSDGEWQTFENASASDYLNKSGKKHRGQEDDADGKIRLNKFIANTGLCSRREADEMIEAGAFKVNGVIVTQLGTKVGPEDKVHYGDQLLRREKMVYVLLNKPKDYITTTDDPQERKTVLDLVAGAGDERIYPVGRLDRNTTGVLLLTNDGDLAERLMHPKYNVEKIYQVSLDMNLRKEDFDKILEGVELEDGFIKADDMSFVGDGEDHKEVGIVLHSGRNRIVRRLFEHLGYTVKHLDRVGYAGLTKKNVPRGKWRLLQDREVGFLKMKVGGDKQKGRTFGETTRSGAAVKKDVNKGKRKTGHGKAKTEEEE
jgi:23S rRNA pseudouridine2605 synthase